MKNLKRRKGSLLFTYFWCLSVAWEGRERKKGRERKREMVIRAMGPI